MYLLAPNLVFANMLNMLIVHNAYNMFDILTVRPIDVFIRRKFFLKCILRLLFLLNSMLNFFAICNCNSGKVNLVK